MFHKILIGYDPRGEAKLKEVVQILKQKSVIIELCDCSGLDYVEATKKACEQFEKDFLIDGLILICGTGIGVTMAANRYSFVRAVLGDKTENVYYARRHEDSNCLCIAGGYDDGAVKVEFSSEEAEKMIDTFLNTDFEGERHAARVQKLSTLGE